jgi:hypothetical protein
MLIQYSSQQRMCPLILVPVRQLNTHKVIMNVCFSIASTAPVAGHLMTGKGQIQSWHPVHPADPFRLDSGH